ncbi:hypothetical protein [Agrobacterium vitis]
MVLNAIAEKLKRQSKDDFKGHCKLIVLNAPSWREELVQAA